MSEPTRAVFLSYASQDAEAARRICEALRSGGVSHSLSEHIDPLFERGDSHLPPLVRSARLNSPCDLNRSAPDVALFSLPLIS